MLCNELHFHADFSDNSDIALLLNSLHHIVTFTLTAILGYFPIIVSSIALLLHHYEHSRNVWNIAQQLILKQLEYKSCSVLQ